MARLLQLSTRLAALERWFDRRFGWFFTNGMKEYRLEEREELHQVRAR